MIEGRARPIARGALREGQGSESASGEARGAEPNPGCSANFFFNSGIDFKTVRVTELIKLRLVDYDRKCLYLIKR